MTLLLDSGELRTFEIAPGTAIRFPDPKLQLLLKDYLTAVTQAGNESPFETELRMLRAARFIAQFQLVPALPSASKRVKWRR